MRSSVALTAVLAFRVLLSCQPAAADPILWEANGHLYEQVAQFATWEEASSIAASRIWLDVPGYLATATSQEEVAFICSQVASSGYVLLGGFQDPPGSDPEANWRWVTEEPWGYTNWDPGQPDDATGPESFLLMYTPSGDWADVGASFSCWFIVEYDLSGACCIGDSCVVSTLDECDQAGGRWFNEFESCDPSPCLPHTCCLSTSCELLPYGECVARNGIWLNALTSCVPDPCPEYACCLLAGCQLMRYDECTAAGGVFLDKVDSCVPSPCPHVCCVDGSCQVLTEIECISLGGTWLSELDACEPGLCAFDILVRPDGSGDYATIQDAINASWSGDVVALTDGTYSGPGNRDIDFLGKAITVRSLSGIAASCVVDCQALGRGFHFHYGEDLVSCAGSS
ncbi:MAG: hypothetical protein KAY32_03575, partial [Candidatus Eisenbacteria sp.]|nr:hypothetical protein [Candidatus Eisenbacteria bacterium]